MLSRISREVSSPLKVCWALGFLSLYLGVPTYFSLLVLYLCFLVLLCAYLVYPPFPLDLNFSLHLYRLDAFLIFVVFTE